MTHNEEELIAALRADIQMWEIVAGHYERLVSEIQLFDGKKTTGIEYAAMLRRRVVEHQKLVERIEKG